MNWSGLAVGLIAFVFVGVLYLRGVFGDVRSK